MRAELLLRLLAPMKRDIILTAKNDQRVEFYDGAAEGLPRTTLSDEAVFSERGRRLVLRTLDDWASDRPGHARRPQRDRPRGAQAARADD